MIRLVFDRLGLRSDIDGGDVLVPGGQNLVVARDVGEHKIKIQDGPWPAFPADLTSIAVALATQCDGLGAHPRVDVREPPDLHRQARAHGRRHHALRPAPRDHQRPEPAARRSAWSRPTSAPAWRCSSPRCAPTALGDRQHPPDRPRLRAHRRAPARARRAHRARRDGTRRRSPLRPSRARRIPSSAVAILPDPHRHPGRPPRRDARAARDHRRAPRVFAESRLRRGLQRRRSSTRTCSRARRSARAPAYRVFDDHGAVLVLRSDMTVPIARVVATRYATAEPPLRFCYFAPRLPDGAPAPRPVREFLQAGIELIGAPVAGRDRGGADGALPRAGRGRAARATGSALGDAALYPRLLDEAGIDGEAREPRPARAADRRLRRPRARDARAGLDDDARGAAAARRRSLRGGPEVLEEVGDAIGDAGRGLRDALRQPRARRRRAADLRPRPRPRSRLLHGRGVRGLRPGARRAARRRWPLRRPARPLRPPAAGGGLRARRRSAAPRAHRRGA